MLFRAAAVKNDLVWVGPFSPKKTDHLGLTSLNRAGSTLTVIFSISVEFIGIIILLLLGQPAKTQLKHNLLIATINYNKN